MLAIMGLRLGNAKSFISLTLAITRPQTAYGYTEVDGGGSGAWQC